MLGLFLPTTGPAEWVDLPQRTLSAPDHDPLRGRHALRSHLLGLEHDRRDTVKRFARGVTFVHRHDLLNQPTNNTASTLLGQTLLGPVVILGTDPADTAREHRAPDSEVHLPRLVDLDPSKLSWESIRPSNSRNAPRVVAAPDTSRPRCVLTVRNIATATSQDSAFDEVMAIVSEYVAATQCTLSNAQSGTLSTGSPATFYYTALAEHPCKT